MRGYEDCPVSQKKLGELQELAVKMDVLETKLWASISRVQNLESTLTVLQEAKTLVIEADKLIEDKKQAKTANGSSRSNKSNTNINNSESKTTDDNNKKCLQNLTNNHCDKHNYTSSPSSSVSRDKKCHVNNRRTENSSSRDWSHDSNYTGKSNSVIVSKSSVDKEKKVVFSKRTNVNSEEMNQKNIISKETSSSSDRKHEIMNRNHGKELEHENKKKSSRSRKKTEKSKYVTWSKKMRHGAYMESTRENDDIRYKKCSSSKSKKIRTDDVNPKNIITMNSKKRINSDANKFVKSDGSNINKNNNYYARNYNFNSTSQSFVKSRNDDSFKNHFSIDYNSKCKTNNDMAKKTVSPNMESQEHRNPRNPQRLTPVDCSFAEKNSTELLSSSGSDGCVKSAESLAGDSFTGKVQTLAGIKTWELPAVLTKMADPSRCNAKEMLDSMKHQQNRMKVIGLGSGISESASVMTVTETNSFSSSVCNTEPTAHPGMKYQTVGKPIPTLVNNRRGTSVSRWNLVYHDDIDTQTQQEETLCLVPNPTGNSQLPDILVPSMPLEHIPDSVYSNCYEAPAMTFPFSITPLNYTANFEQPGQVVEAPSVCNYAVRF